MVNDVVVAMLVAHVDDITIAATKQITDSVVADLNKRFPTKHLGEVLLYMVASTIEILRREPWRFQPQFIRNVGEHFRISKTSPIATFLSLALRHVNDKDPAVDASYHEMVGSLMWIASQTRPDIDNAVRAVARISHDPKEVHVKAARKIIEYLSSTAH